MALQVAGLRLKGRRADRVYCREGQAIPQHIVGGNPVAGHPVMPAREMGETGVGAGGADAAEALPGGGGVDRPPRLRAATRMLGHKLGEQLVTVRRP